MLTETTKTVSIADKQRKQDICFVLLLFAIACLYYWKAPMGYVTNDEAFYLSTPYRILQGDGYLTSEWNLAQLSSFLLLIPMKLYLMIFNSTEGIYYAFRLIFLGVQLINTVCIYLLLRKKGWITLVACALFALFIPYGIMALNYNSMALSSEIMISAIILSEYHGNRILQVIEGVLLGCAIMCNPYIVFIYLINLVLCCIYRKRDSKIAVLNTKNLMMITIGCLFIGCPFLVLLFSRGSLAEIINNLHYILQDPTHEGLSFGEHINNFLYYCKPFIIELSVVILCFIQGRDSEKRKKYSVLLQCTLSILLLHMAVFHISGFGSNAIGYNAVAAVMAIYGLFIIVYQKPQVVFKIVWLFGIMIAVCNYFASNQYAFVVTEALLVSSFSTLYMLSSIDTGIKPANEKSTITLLGCQLIALIYVFGNHVYWEDDLSLLDSEINNGPMKGIYCTQKEYDKYYSYLSDFNEIKKDDFDSPVLFYQNIPWAYMYTESEVGCFSTWGEAIDTLDSQLLLDYYELYPQKTPKLIYVDNTTFSADMTFFYRYAKAHGYTLKLLDSGAIILGS